jgi:membrane associated rhomboid family serine protease
MNGYSRGFFGMSPAVKNIVYINIIMFLAMLAARSAFQIDLNRVLGVYFYKSELFRPFQIVTHMFMHGDIGHIVMNMFGLFMFAPVLERVWGSKRFLIYYFVTGLGALLINEAVLAFEYHKILGTISPDVLQDVLDNGLNKEMWDQSAIPLLRLLYAPTVGASGAVFGVLLAFGVLFPNTELLLLFPPIPIKAKYVVAGYGAIELYYAVSQPGSTIAHAAHLGGMLFGYLLIRYWRKTTNTLY